MELLNKLEDYYGFANENIKNELIRRTQKYSPEEQEMVYQKIIVLQPMRRGFPDMAMLNKIFQEVKPRYEPSKYYWCVCNECGCEYSYNLPTCPACWKRGFECHSYTVKVSEVKPPVKVVTFNKCYNNYKLPEDTSTCFDCKDTEMSYCPNFGKPDYFCKDYQYCKCKNCCALHKRINEKLTPQVNVKSYAIPRKDITAITEGGNNG